MQSNKSQLYKVSHCSQILIRHTMCIKKQLRYWNVHTQIKLYLVISAQFTSEMYVAAWNREKFTKTPILGVQGRSRSSMLVPPESSACYVERKSVSICNVLMLDELIAVRQVLSGYSSLMPSFEEKNILTQRQEVAHKKLETIRYHTVKTRSLYLTWAWFGGTGKSEVTPRRTDRQTDRRTDRQNYDS